MKSTSKKRTPSIVNLTVKRRYLTEREVERLMDCARKHGRYGHRDATMILVAYRHGLRATYCLAGAPCLHSRKPAACTVIAMQDGGAGAGARHEAAAGAARLTSFLSCHRTSMWDPR